MRFLLIIVLFFCISCGGKKEQIFIAGSSAVFPIVNQMIQGFVNENKLIAPPIINGGDSSYGFYYVASKKIDIAMMARDISVEEKEQFSGVNFVVTTIAYDAVVPVVSPEIYNAGVRVLTKLQLRGIYSGGIKNWKQIGGPDKEIIVCDTESKQEVRQTFMKSIFGDAKAKANGADKIINSHDERQRAIIQSDRAIGILSLAGLNKGVRPVALKVDGQVYQATRQSLRNRIFPITRVLNLVTNGEPKSDIKRFIDFVLSSASQRAINKLGYIAVSQ